MKAITLALTLLAALAIASTGAEPKDEVKAAAKKLAEKPNYSWTVVAKSQGGGGGPGGDSDGKTEKDGFTFVTLSVGNNDVEMAFKGDKAAIKRQDEWQAADELEGNNAWIGRSLKAFKAPAAEAEDFLTKIEDVKKGDDGVYSGELSDAGIKELFTRMRRGNRGATPSDTKGSVKFWLKEGVLSKYQYNVQGKITVGQDKREVEIDRTTTVEIKEAGTTKVNIPEDAKKKLS